MTPLKYPELIVSDTLRGYNFLHSFHQWKIKKDQDIAVFFSYQTKGVLIILATICFNLKALPTGKKHRSNFNSLTFLNSSIYNSLPCSSNLHRRIVLIIIIRIAEDIVHNN